ncbi:HNH endonuclease [Neobacillus sp.]|uniref:HNH endonuclease n=1 Tax=Neobacillus sp. TaxID=2675273 RepID=UPI0028993BEB|nr:HNH endonuclease [Neobacillus sp.]
MAPKEQLLALSSGIGLAGLAVANFWDYGREAIEVYKKEIIECVLKPKKETAIHHYLKFFQNIEEVDMMWKNADLDKAYDFIVRILEEVNLKPNLPEPDFESCDEEYGHYGCECNEIVEQWIAFVSENMEHIDELIKHSAFQFIFQDRKFLHDFHLELADLIEREMDYIKTNYSEYVTTKDRLRRKNFPAWLKQAVFYREKGTCAICRCDLSNLIRNQNQIHIDHIIPLNLFGTNDSSNMQLLCEACNTSKGDRTTETSSINVPFWNL